MHDVHGSQNNYLACNDIIFEYFFNPSRNQQPTTLGFDDTEVANVGSAVGDEPTAFIEMLTSSVSALYKLRSGFGWWTRRKPRERVGLLACSVLVMARQPKSTDGTGFYKRYSNEILRLDMDNAPNGYEQHDLWWKELEEYTNVRQNGKLGRLMFFELTKYTHLNFPASQCLLRGADRKWLREFFTRACDPEVDLSKTGYLTMRSAGGATETVGIRSVEQELALESELSTAIWTIIAGEFESWRNTSDQQGVVNRRRDRRITDASLPGANYQSGLREKQATAKISKATKTPHIRQRLALSVKLGHPYRLGLDAVLPLDALPPGVAPSSDGWCRMPNLDLSSSHFLYGYDLDVEGIGTLSASSSDVAVFVLQNSRWTQTTTAPLALPTIILYDEDLSSELEPFIFDHMNDHNEINLDPGLTGLKAFKGVFPNELTSLPMPELLGSELKSSTTELSIRSGLRLRSGSYLAVGPPAVSFYHPSTKLAELFLDGEPCDVLTNGIPVILSKDLKEGLHTISVLDKSRTFRIATSDEECEGQEGAMEDSLAFITRREPPLVKTQSDALCIKLWQLEEINAAVVCGADVGLPYERFKEAL